MGLIDDIKSEADDKGVRIQDSITQKFEDKLNSLFYAPKNMEEEVKFVKQMFTRGGVSSDRRGLHTSAIIVGEDSFCYREQVLSLIFEQAQGENVKIGLKRIFEEGNAIHEKWQRLFIRGGLCKAEDCDFSKYSERYDVGYTPDIIATFGDQQIVVEIKSVNTYQFKKMMSHPSAYKQIQMYMHFTGIHKGMILCDDKNTQEFKIFLVKYNPEDIKTYLMRLDEVADAKAEFLNNKNMVARCEQCKTKYSARAMKCQMRDACWNCGKGRVRLKDV